MAKEHVEFIWIQLDRRTLKWCYLPYLSFRKGGTDNSHRLCPALTVVGELCSEKTEQWSSQRHFWKGTVANETKEEMRKPIKTSSLTEVLLNAALCSRCYDCVAWRLILCPVYLIHIHELMNRTDISQNFPQATYVTPKIPKPCKTGVN